MRRSVLFLAAILSVGLVTAGCGGPEATSPGGAPDASPVVDSASDGAGTAPSPDSAPAPDVPSTPDADASSTPDTASELCPEGGCFGAPCEGGDDCFSGLCAEHMGDTVCTKTCNDDCPGGWSCEQVTGASGDPIYICVSSFEHLCRPCMSGGDCASSTSEAACVDYDGQGAFCGATCDGDGDCPQGFVCQESASTRGGTSRQCVDVDGVCECSGLAVDLGLATSCSITSDAGTCEGIRVCTDQGLTACDAATPVEESCSGADDDCDGEIDEVDCDDDNPCTTDTCAGAAGCENLITPGVACDDGDPGTRDDACNVIGECSGWPIECPQGGCILTAEPNGVDCDITYKAAGALCDDEDPTTADDQCDGADLCQGVPYTCEPGPCELASVPNGVGCDAEYWASGTPCDDGLAETAGDQCDGLGGCAGEPYTCEATQCEAASVPDGVGCVATPKVSGSACDDGALTTHNDACDGAGACVGTAYGCDAGLCVDASTHNGVDCDITHTPEGVGCDDGDPNTKTDACDGQGGCVGQVFGCEKAQCEASSVPDGAGCAVQYKVAGYACDDGDVATVDDQCDGQGGCAGTAYTCEAGLCQDSATPNGTDCDVAYTPAGVGCDDGDASTKIDACDGTGECMGTPYTCETTQCMAVNVPNGVDCDVTFKAVGIACDDGDPTTQDDQCDGQGACAGTAYGCAPGLCEVASVPDGAGCDVTYAIVSAACDDGDPGTLGDQCDGSGGCAGTPYACIVDPCDVSSTPNGFDCDVEHAAVGTPCDDGDPTTKDDQCDGGGACVGETYGCSPSQCEASSVADGDGCAVVYVASGIGCDDGDATTKDDLCDGAGGCLGTPYECQPTQCELQAIPDGVGCVIQDAPASVACDDGDPATKVDVCDGFGACAGTPYTCEPGPCDAASVPDGTGCVVTPKAEGVGCDDGDATTKGDQCDGQSLCVGTPYTCEPGTCELASTPDGVGCQPVYAQAETPCDDLDLFTKVDICDGQGGCQGTPYTCEPDQCEAAANPNGVDCEVVPKAPGFACDDGDLTTKADQCDGQGACVGAPYSCPTTQCEASATHNGLGCDVVDHGPTVACDDGDLTTQSDLCDGQGGCAGTPYACLPGQCDLSSIHNGDGCDVVHHEATVPCDDTDPGTKGDLCDGQGGCQGTVYTCTPGTCETASVPDGVGCDVTYADDTTGCDDGDLSTQGDLCDGQGGCQGTPYACVADPCDVSSTHNGTDCDVIHQEVGFGCDDGEPTTKDDQCDGQGDCFGSPYACIPAVCEASSTHDGAGCEVVYEAAQTSCDDGDPATVDDVCDGDGGCQGVPPTCGDGVHEGLEPCDDGPGNCATVGCTSSATVSFDPTGDVQTWTVPAGVTSVTVKLWGAAGGGSNAENKQWPGGGGGFAQGQVPVTPGETLDILVGQGGASGQASNAWPHGGKASTRPGYNMGGGGGRSAIERAGTELVVAGGGGGAGGTGWSSPLSTAGGGGGGSTGGDGSYAAYSTGVTGEPCRGRGGTQSAGGAGGDNCEGWTGNPGAKNQGADAIPWQAGNCGGGGGDGYYGGGAGSLHAGGGGGSGYLDGSVSEGDLIAGDVSGNPGGTADPDYPTGVAVGSSSAAGAGGHVVIHYAVVPACPYGSEQCTLCDVNCDAVVLEGTYCGDGVVQADHGETCDDGNDVAGDGCSPTCESQYTSCRAIRDVDAASPDGTYWIDPDGEGGDTPFPVYCDMTHDGGGWTLVAAVHRANNYDVSEPKHWFVNGQNSAPLATNTDTFDATPSSFGAEVWAPLLVGDTAVARFDVHAHLDFDVRHSWFKGAPEAAFSQWFADDTTATDVCLDVALTEGCQSGRIQHTGDKTELTGMNLTAHGYPADNHLHMRQDGELSGQFSAICSSTGNNDDNAWPDSGMDGHWGNGLRIWLRPAVCGDGIIEGGETCEDGNTDPGDGCSSVCKDEVYVDCAAHLEAIPGLSDGVQTIDPDGDGPGAPFEVFCDMDGDGGPYTLPVWTPDAPGLMHLYDFTQAPNHDFAGTRTLVIDLSRYSTLGLNLNGLSNGGDYVYYIAGRTMILTMRRDFAPDGDRSGMIFSTTDEQNDDGITIRDDRIGTRTHSNNYELKGTSLTSVLPTEGASESFGMRMEAQGASFHHGGGWSSVSSVGGAYDSCWVDRLYMGSNDGVFDPWDDGDLYVQTLAVFDIEVPEEVLSDYLENLSLLFP